MFSRFSYVWVNINIWNEQTSNQKSLLFYRHFWLHHSWAIIYLFKIQNYGLLAGAGAVWFLPPLANLIA